MATGSTVHSFQIALSDADRGVYESLDLRVARHPSETDDYLCTRVLAYCLEYAEGIAFSKGGLSNPDEPALLIKDLTGAWQAWIEIGSPDAARLHKAAKLAPRVAVYCHREPEQFLRRLRGETIHRAAELVLVAVERELLDALVARLTRRMDLSVTVTGGELYLTLGDTTLTSRVRPLSLAAD